MMRMIAGLWIALVVCACLSVQAGESGEVGGRSAKPFKQEMREAWGCPGEEILHLGLRSWFSEGRTEVSRRYPANPAGTGDTFSDLEVDDAEVTVMILEGELRVPYVRWLRLLGQANILSPNRQAGEYFDQRWNGLAPQTLTRNAQGRAQIMDLDCFEINVGVRVLGQDAFWHKRPSRSSLTLIAGWRNYIEDVKLSDEDNILTGQHYDVDATYRLDWSLKQVGFRAQLGFDDMMKGLHSIIDFNYLWGGQCIGRYRDATRNEYITDRTNGEGFGIRASLGYKRDWFSVEFGHEWMWLEGRHGHTADGGEVHRLDTNRCGFFLTIGLHF